MHDGSMCVGWVRPSRGAFYFPYEGKEYTCKKYEVLVEGYFELDFFLLNL